jgi:hypothetical protein
MQGDNIAFGLQIKNHKKIVSRIAAKLGGLPKAKHYLNKCLYYVNIGSNDYINNYYQPLLYSTSHIYNPERYAQILINQLSHYIEVYLLIFFSQKTNILILLFYVCAELIKFSKNKACRD